MNIGHVQGGTNAGWRKVKQPIVWTHDCKTERVTGLDVKVSLSTYSCPVCGARRPS